MTTALITFLIILDIGLIVSMFFLNKKQEIQSDLLVDLTEERRLLNELRENVKNELSQAQIKNREAINKVSYLAAEAEQEVKNSGNSIASTIEEIVTELSIRFDKPLSELAKRQGSVESLIKKLTLERERISKIVARGESLVKFFDEKTSLEDVIKDLETKKYDDCRHLLARGISEDQIALELGMSRSEVRLVSGIS